MRNLFVIILLLSANALFAQSDSLVLQSSADEMLNTDTRFLGSITPYTSSVFNQLPKDEVASMTVFTSEEIENLGFNNIYDLLNYVPGFQSFENISAYGAMPKVSVRGMNHEFNSSILILLNGKRLNDALFASGTSFMRYFSLRLVKKVEIVRGSGTLRFGDKAYVGLINLITNTDKTDAFIDVRVPWGTSLSMNANKNIGSTSRLTLSGTGFETSGHKYNFDGQETKSPSIVGQLVLAYETPKFRAHSFYSSYNSRDFVNVGYVANNINRTQDQLFHLNLEYDWVNDEKLLLTSSLSGNRVRKELVSLLASDTSTASGEPWYGGPLIGGIGLSFRNDGKYDFSKAHKIKFGLGLLTNSVENVNFFSNHFDANFTDLSPQDTTAQSSIFLVENPSQTRMRESRQFAFNGYFQYDLALSERWKFSAGTRVDKYNSSDFELSPRASLIFQTPSQSTFKLLASSTVRIPSLAETAINLFSLQGNALLETEKMESVEFIYMKDMKRFSFMGSIFANRQENRIIYNQLTGSWQNLSEETVVKGGEVSFRAVLEKRLTLNMSYSLAYGDLSALVYRHFGTLGLSYSTNKINLMLSSLFRGRASNSNNFTEGITPDFEENYIVFNIKMRYRSSPRLTFFVFGQNLSNERFRTTSETLFTTGGFPLVATGAEIRGGIEFRFGLISVEGKK